MTTIWTAAMAWIGWNIVGPMLFVLGVVALVGICSIPGAIRRARCPHLRFYEPTVGQQACHGICCDCGKDLGFIDDVRARAYRIRKG